MLGLHIAYSFLGYFLVPFLLLITFYRYQWYRLPRYSFSLAQVAADNDLAKKSYHRTILFFIRFIILFFLVFLIMRPQWVDRSSKTDGQGRDIVIAIDVSGSMQVFDDVRDRRQRIKVAKDEAINFIDRRIDDPIGIVIFAKDALSRSPITLDKMMLKKSVQELYLGFIDPNGTSLGTGLATAVNRLRKSKSKSKIIIMLTDGEPTQETDRISPEIAINLAKEYGIKVYTVGIGNEKGGYMAHPFGGLQRMPVSIDVILLKKIAQETGGQFFRANNPDDMRKIYHTIDKLEKTDYTTDLFHRYYEAFLQFIWFVVLFLFIELFLKLFVWRGI